MADPRENVEGRGASEVASGLQCDSNRARPSLVIMDREASSSTWAERLAALRRRLEELTRDLEGRDRDRNGDAPGRMSPVPVPVRIPRR